MATLNENIANVKKDFGRIKGTVNNFYAEYGEDPIIMSDTPTSMYGEIIGTQFAERLAEMGYQDGREEGVEVGKYEILSNSKYIPKSAIGKFISLTDVSEVAHKVKVYGDNQEVEVYGKNLLPYPYAHTTRTTEGITFTDNGNGTITANGTATGNAYFSLTETSRGVGFNVKAGEQYVLRGCPDGGSTSTYMVYSQSIGAQDYGNGAISTVSTEDKSVNVAIVIYKGVTVSNLIFKPMISLANIFDKTYEPYTHQTITATYTGTEIDSMCPNMTFITYSDAEANLLVEYYSSFGMAEKDLEMWNAFTNSGARDVYDRAFSYSNYSGKTIPNGLCRPTRSFGYMFYAYAGAELPKGVDCSDFDVTQTATNIFGYASYVKHIYDMGIPALKSYNACYRNCNALKTIDIIRVNEGTTFDNNSFIDCIKLTHVIFSGVIASDINLQWSPLLDDESAVSLLKCLKENNNYVATVTLHPDVWARLDAMPAETWGEAGNAKSYIANKGWFFA